MATGKGKGWHPTATRFAWLPVGKLNSLRFRPVRAGKVGRFVKKFDPDAIGVLYISQRRDGSYHVIDGNHRREAVHRMWGPEAQVPCLIYTGLTDAQEHMLFVDYNEERTKPQPIHIFLAKVGGHEPIATAVAEIVTGKHGLEITAAPGVARLAAVQAVTTLYEQGGAGVLDTALTVVSDAWGKHTDSYHTQVLNGVGVLLARYPQIDLARLTKVLAETKPKRLVARAYEARCSELDTRTTDTKSGSFVARIILSQYNRRLRQAQVLTWMDQPGSYYWTEAAEYSRLALQKLAEQVGDES